MTKQISVMFLALCALFVAGHCERAQAGQSIWNHNGSQMLLQSYGNQRVITYYVPRRGISAKRGRILFRGTRNGQTYSGTAYTFRRGCAPAPYQVSGVLSSEYEIVLHGASPVRRGCRVTGYTRHSGNSTLVFTYIRKLGGTVAPDPAPAPQPPAIDPGFAGQQAPQQLDPGFAGPQNEGPQVGPVEKIIRQIPNGEIIFRVQDEDDPVSAPIRIDAHVQCYSGRRATVFTNYRTCAFDGLTQSQNGSALIMNLREYNGNRCADKSDMRIQTNNLCH